MRYMSRVVRRALLAGTPRLEQVLGHIGANVHARRTRRALTQEGLAVLAGLDLRFVQRVERGRTNLSVAVLIALAEVLECSPAALLEPATLLAPRVGRPPRSPRR